VRGAGKRINLASTPLKPNMDRPEQLLLPLQPPRSEVRPKSLNPCRPVSRMKQPRLLRQRGLGRTWLIGPLGCRPREDKIEPVFVSVHGDWKTILVFWLHLILFFELVLHEYKCQDIEFFRKIFLIRPIGKL